MTAAVRVRWDGGQFVRADDLDTDMAAEQHLGARHIRAAHGTWGVALGYWIGWADHNAQGVVVGPGLAYDRCGSALLSWQNLWLPFPSDAVGSLLLAVGPAAPPRERSLGCADHGVRLRWAHPELVRPDEVPLAEVSLKGGLASIGTDQRATVRESWRIASGSTSLQAARAPSIILTVDTTSGDFDSTPFYFATVVDSDDGFGLGANSPKAWTAMLPLVRVKSPAKSSFEVEVAFVNYDATLVDDLRLNIDWIGVEPLAIADLGQAIDFFNAIAADPPQPELSDPAAISVLPVETDPT